jgi:ParB-like chromosome segregation protein Spo0J
MSLSVNPDYEKLMPRMSDEEFAELKESIQSDGQHYPIVANENLEVLDGHHRLRACVELGIEPDFEVRKFEDKLLEKKFVIEANLRRRHLNKFQLVELGVPLLEIEKELAKGRKISGGKQGRNIQLGLASNDAKPVFKGKATAAVAKRIGVSTRTFERGKKIVEKANEEDKEQLRDGKASISRVYNKIVTLEKSDQNAEEDHAEPAAITAIRNDPRFEQNKLALSQILKRLIENELFCPACGNQMLECSKCHKTLQESLEENT